MTNAAMKAARRLHGATIPTASPACHETVARIIEEETGLVEVLNALQGAYALLGIARDGLYPDLVEHTRGEISNLLKRYYRAELDPTIPKL